MFEQVVLEHVGTLSGGCEGVLSEGLRIHSQPPLEHHRCIQLCQRLVLRIVEVNLHVEKYSFSHIQLIRSKFNENESQG